jgi:transcriptional regulator with XRE-family HTH domain
MKTLSPIPLAALLTTHCAAEGLSMRELSLRAGRGPKLVSDIVHGKSRNPSPATLEALARVTGLPGATLSAAVPAVFAGPTLQDALQAIDRSDLADARKAEVRRDVQALCRHLQRPPAAVSAHHQSLKALLTGPNELRVGTTAKPQANFTANIERAVGLLRGVGLAKAAHRLSPAWTTLLDRLTKGEQKARVARFFRYCDGRGLTPDQVSDAVIKAYLTHLQTHGALGVEPERWHKRVRETITLWNRSARTLQEWPTIQLAKLSDACRVFAVDDSHLVAMLREFDEKYAPWARREQGRTDEPPEAPADRRSRYDDAGDESDWRTSALAPRTLERHRVTLVLAAKTLLNNGASPEAVQAIAHLITPDAIRQTLCAIEDRLSEDEDRDVPFEESAYSHTVARTLRTIAATWDGADATALARIARYVNSALPGPIGPDGKRRRARGMTERNRRRLRQFSQRRISDFLWLPNVLIAEAEKARRRQRGTVDLARQVSVAVALLLLRAAPVRRQNLATITLTRHGWP